MSFEYFRFENEKHAMIVNELFEEKEKNKKMIKQLIKSISFKMLEKVERHYFFKILFVDLTLKKTWIECINLL